MGYIDYAGRSIPLFDLERQYRNGWMDINSRNKYEMDQIRIKEENFMKDLISKQDNSNLIFQTPKTSLKIIIDTEPVNYFIKSTPLKITIEDNETNYLLKNYKPINPIKISNTEETVFDILKK